MQFHLNGFHPGNPHVNESPSSADGLSMPDHASDVDVLIVGSGPTGLTLAAQLSCFPDLRTRVVEQKSGPLRVGQADGIACRTMEMFEAFGFCERVLREAYWVNEVCFWRPLDRLPEQIGRSRIIQDVEEGLSEFPHVILNQSRVHDFYLDLMDGAPARIRPEYSRRLVNLIIDSDAAADPSGYAVTVQLESTDGRETGAVEEVRARYVVGCDGARSATRQLVGLSLEGESASQAWGVMDVLAVTDFPDIRKKAVIHSATEGSMLIIPREGGYLVRMYIELDQLAEDQRVSSLNVNSEKLISAAQRILNPYRLVVKEVAWWSVYEIGQRLSRRFDNQAVEGDHHAVPRVFIAGDACHTHSPKAGQGMNVSMQDAFNLGWKLASVARGRASPEILATYSGERHSIAKELIEFDQELARMFSARPKLAGDAADDGVDTAAFQSYFVKSGRFTAGTATQYRESLLTGHPRHQGLARGFLIGSRFHSARVTRLADARVMHLGHTLRADGRWRLFAFGSASTPADRSSELWKLCDFLENSPESPVRLFTAAEEDIDSVIEVIAICQQPHRALCVQDLPAMLRPRKGRLDLVDYEKVFCADPAAAADIYEIRGIDRSQGALIIVRPDQYIAHVLPLGAHQELSTYFGAFMLMPSGGLKVRPAGQ